MAHSDSTNPGLSRPAHKASADEFYGTPAGQALELRTTCRGADTSGIAMPLIPATAQADGTRIHPGAIVVAVDQALGMSVSGDRPRHLVTLDLRIDWLCPIIPSVDILCSAQASPINRRTVSVRGEVHADENGPVIAYAVGQFLLGASAGGFRDSKPARPIDFEHAAWESFDSFLGVRREADTYVLDPAHHRVGSLYLPAIHGGVIAASLQQAMMLSAEGWRPDGAIALVSSSFRFLNAGAALKPLTMTTRWVRKGRSVGLIEAAATQAGGDEPVAVAQAMFLAVEGANSPRVW